MAPTLLSHLMAPEFGLLSRFGAQAKRREQVLSSLAHLIPRDSMFVVAEGAPARKPPATQ